MDHKYIEDHHVVARYLADQLSDADREAFEAFCQANPAIYREIEAAARFKVGLAKLDESKQLQPLIEAKPHTKPFQFKHAAAIAGVALGGALLYGAVTALRVPVMGATVAEVSGRFRDPLPVVGDFVMMRMRDTKPEVLELRLPKERGVFELRILPTQEDASSYRVKLRKVTAAGEGALVSLDGLAPGDDRLVTIYLSSEKLTPGTYELMVVPDGQELDPRRVDFRFEVADQQQFE